jgi:hypothetical protein
VFVLLLLATPTLAEEVGLESRVSICVNPATPALVVHSDTGRKKFPGCREWSSFVSTSRALDVQQFQNCTDPEAPLPDFISFVLQMWNGQSPASKPITSTMFAFPGRFQLRPLRPGESRSDSLIVWKGMAAQGMAALVVADTSDRESPSMARPQLAHLKIRYPGRSECGTLIESDAQTLATDLVQRGIVKKAEDYQLLVARRARLFWSHWIEDDHGGEQPAEIKVGEVYRYRIAFSALDFEAFHRGDQQARDRLSPDEIGNHLPTQIRYRISVLPVGNFVEQRARSEKLRIDEKILKGTLTEAQVPNAGSYGALAARHDALVVVADSQAESRSFSYEFTVTKPGCPGLAVIVWSEYPRKFLTSWIRPFRAVSPDPPPSPDAVREMSDDPAGQADPCAKPVEVSRPVGPAAVPWFDTADDSRAIARLAFVDFLGSSIGGFQDLRFPDQEPLSWVVEQPLRKSLADFGDFVNARVNGSNFSMAEPSKLLWQVLFRCQGLSDNDPDCSGIEALRRLRHIAADSAGSRVQVSFRDIAANGTYYLPIHLLDQTDSSTLVGRQLRFVQPLPVPVSESGRQAGCVREWSGGLIVNDSDGLDEKWRMGFVTGLVTAARHQTFRSLYTLETLRDDYFSNTRLTSGGSEGLVVLAHHGDGDISDTKVRDSLTRIKPDQVKRTFHPGSITLLVACSVGRLGDPDESRSRFLFSLNGRTIRAAVISPFQVSPALARAFLENFKSVVEKLDQDTTLFEIVDKVKARIQDPNEGEASLGLQAAVETFMVVGDGDVTICKKGETQ